MDPDRTPQAAAADALQELQATGRRLVDALRDQLADGQVEHLMSVTGLVSQLRQAEAALADTAQRAIDWNANAERALEWASDEIGKRLEAATGTFHAQAAATETGLRAVAEELTAELVEQLRVAGRSAAAQVEQALAEAAQALADGIVEAEYRIAVAREEHVDRVEARLQSAPAKAPRKRAARAAKQEETT